MGYIIGLTITLAIIFSMVIKPSILSDLLSGNIAENIKQKVIEFTSSPLSEKEIIINGLNSNYGVLEKFFSDSAPNILKSKNISEEDKTAIKKAEESFNSLKELTPSIEKNFSNNSSGIIKTIIDRITGNSNNNTSGPEPTFIPPQCQIICPENK